MNKEQMLESVMGMLCAISFFLGLLGRLWGNPVNWAYGGSGLFVGFIAICLGAYLLKQKRKSIT
jgi:ABC-type multidrug transport system permease subunit